MVKKIRYITCIGEILRICSDHNVKAKIRNGGPYNFSGDALPYLKISNKVKGGADEKNEPSGRHLRQQAGNNPDIRSQVFVKPNLIECRLVTFERRFDVVREMSEQIYSTGAAHYKERSEKGKPPPNHQLSNKISQFSTPNSAIGAWP